MSEGLLGQIYNPFTCDLIIASTSNELNRLSLDEGKFLQPFSAPKEESIYRLEYK